MFCIVIINHHHYHHPIPSEGIEKRVSNLCINKFSDEKKFLCFVCRVGSRQRYAALSLSLSLSLSLALTAPLFYVTVEYSSRRYLFQKISRQMGRVDAPVEEYDGQNRYINQK